MDAINELVSKEVLSLTGAKKVMIFDRKQLHSKSIHLASIYPKQPGDAHEVSSLHEINQPLFERTLQTITKPEAQLLEGEELKSYKSTFLLPKESRQVLLIPITSHRLTFGALCLCSDAHVLRLNISQRLWPLTMLLAERRRKASGIASCVDDELLKSTKLAHFDDLFVQIENNIDTAIIEINPNHKITRFNPAAEVIFGFPADQILNENIDKIIPENFPNQHKTHTFSRILMLQKKSMTSKLLGRHSEGNNIPIDIKIIQYQRQHQVMSLLLIEDLTLIQTIKEQQREQIQRFRAVADLAPVGILQTNYNWEATYVNNRWCEICKVDESKVMGLNWISAFYHEDITQSLESLREAISSGHEFSGECRFHSHLGGVIWVELCARPTVNSLGETDGFVATLTDSTYRHITEEKLRLMAERDELTHLANRSLFVERLSQALKKCERHSSLALLCLDLDGFKTINDTLGHDAGDRLLQAVARRLESCVRREDTVARLGGDEFSILLEFISSPNTASDIAEKVLKVLERPFLLQATEVFISTSIGITFSHSGENTTKTILKEADIALYRAKAVGRNNYQYFSPELEIASKQRMYIGNSLHRALERLEFDTFYQLQANMKTGAIIGSEALLRWNHPQRGLLPPSEFLDILEETSLILPASRWLWKQAFPQHRKWVDLGLIAADGHISVNLSQRQLREPDLADQLLLEIAKSELSPNQVLVEITETALIEDSPQTMEVLNQLRSAGVKIALDDFGTGFSSLTYLKKFPIHYIKIDQSFIRDLLNDKDDAAITHAVVNLAHTLDLTVIAEGVDHPAKRDQLATWSCDQYQGYILNEPAHAWLVQELLESYLQKTNNAS